MIDLRSTYKIKFVMHSQKSPSENVVTENSFTQTPARTPWNRPYEIICSHSAAQ